MNLRAASELKLVMGKSRVAPPAVMHHPGPQHAESPLLGTFGGVRDVTAGSQA